METQLDLFGPPDSTQDAQSVANYAGTYLQDGDTLRRPDGLTLRIRPPKKVGHRYHYVANSTGQHLSTIWRDNGQPEIEIDRRRYRLEPVGHDRVLVRFLRMCRRRSRRGV